MSLMKDFLDSSHLFGGNAAFIEELYESYLDNPQSVPEQWRDYFDRLQLAHAGGGPAPAPPKRQPRPHIAELEPAYYDLTEADLETVFNTGTLIGPERATLREILQMLRETYCGSFGAEYMYISDSAQKRWIQQRIEAARGRPS